MLWSVGKQISPRGAGLGNEIFPWAKAYLAARALDLVCIEPAWRLNPRRYDRQLGGTFASSTGHWVARALPSVEITSARYHSTNVVDYYEAMRHLQPQLISARSPVLLHSSGMSGGYLAIRRAKRFLRKSILGSEEAILALAEVDTAPSAAVRVAVHVRGGDFQRGNSVQESTFNQALPLEWYKAQLETLASSLGCPIEVFVATDGPQESTADALALGNIRPRTVGTSSISDLAILADCDVLISSVSSFSLLAAFLSDAPYIWHRDQLGERGGWLSIWGHEPASEGGGFTQTSIKQSLAKPPSVFRGHAHSLKPVWDNSLIEYLRHRASMRETNTDLIHYGVIPEGRPRP